MQFGRTRSIVLPVLTVVGLALPALSFGSEYCFGDGSGIQWGGVCPCDNYSAAGSRQGCRNSTGVGARLTCAGNATLSGDSLVLTTTGMRPDKWAVIFEGRLPDGNTAYGHSWMDGLDCVDSITRRVVTRKTDANGNLIYPASGDPHISDGGGIQANSSRYYTVAYRDGTGPCGTKQNQSNGIAVFWFP